MITCSVCGGLNNPLLVFMMKIVKNSQIHQLIIQVITLMIMMNMKMIIKLSILH